MLPDPRTSSEGDLVELDAGLRRFAARLVADGATVDDVVQDAWLAAIERPPKEFRDPRSWMRAVILNKHRRRLRHAARRAELEAAGARAEAVAPDADALDRTALRASLDGAIEAVGEPYASVLRLRFWKQAPIADIARELGRPEGTVKVQVQRGLERVRAHLDRVHGSRRRWELAAIAAFEWRIEDLPPAVLASATALTGAALLARVASVLALLLGGGWALSALLARAERAEPRIARVEGARGAQRTAAEEVVAAPSAGDEASAADPAGARAALVEEARGRAAPESAASSSPDGVQVTVLDPAGDPRAGAELFQVLRGRELRLGTADAAGRVVTGLELEDLPEQPGFGERRLVALFASAAGFARSDLLLFEPEAGSRELELRLPGPELVLRGRVLDAAGAPVAGARVWVRDGAGSARRQALDGLPVDVTRPRVEDVSLESGAYELRGLYGARRPFAVSAEKPGFARAELDVPWDTAAWARLDLTLAPGAELRGRVVSSEGEPVAGARVHMGSGRNPLEGAPRTRTDASGEFVLNGLDDGLATVWAVSPDGRAARENVRSYVSGAELAEVELVLGELPPLRLRAVGEDGRPLRATQVLFVHHEPDPTAALSPDSEPRTVAWTDEDGVATFPLLDALEGAEAFVEALVFDVTGAQRTEVGATTWQEPDAEVREVRCSRSEERWFRARGTLVDADGEPVPGVRLYVYRPAAAHMPSFTTGRDGRFELEGIEAGELVLFAEVPGRGWADLGRLPVEPGTQAELGTLELPRYAPLVLDFDPPAGEEREHRYEVAQQTIEGLVRSGWSPVATGDSFDRRPVEVLWGVYMVSLHRGADLVTWRVQFVGPAREVVVPLGDPEGLVLSVAVVGSAAESVDVRVYQVPMDSGGPVRVLVEEERLRAESEGELVAELTALPVQDVPGSDFLTSCAVRVGGLVVYAEDERGRRAGYRLNVSDARMMAHVTLVLE